MKITRTFKPFGLSLAALALLGMLSTGRAFDPNNESYVNAFDDSASVTSWFAWYNWAATITWDSTMYNPATTGNAGSMRVQLVDPYNQGTTPQLVYFGTYGNTAQWDKSVSINGNLYTNVTFDILVDSNCAVNNLGTYGGYTVGFVNDASGWIALGSVSIPAEASNHWVHYVVPIPKNLSADISSVYGIGFQMTSWWDGDPSRPPAAGLTNWVDNLTVEWIPGPPPPTPTISGTLRPAIVGLNQTATDSAGQYDRYNILTALPTGNSFVGQPSVTYAWTNKVWPNTNTAGSWQQQLFFISGPSSSGAPSGNPGQYDSAADWNYANILWFTVQANADGTGYLQFRAKTNFPNGNGMLFNTETNFSINTNLWPVEPIVQINASSPLGGWSVTFANDTNITITTPDGTSTNFVLDPAWAALFADPMTLALGSQPNNANGYGQTEVISGFGVTGNASPFSDDFTADAQLDTNKWRVLAGDPNGVHLVPAGSFGWLSWTRPDSGFAPQTAAEVGAPALSWVGISNPTIVNNALRSVLVKSSELQGTDQNFFRLIKRSFNGLQVLLPGETAAPGTVTGKTGSPDPANTSDVVNVIVNAVDTNGWYAIPGVTDTISISSSDGGAILPNNAALANGTGTFPVLFQNTGPQTVTATDVTTNSIPPATSSSVTVN